jgi:uncharacterized membrane protein YfhO
LSRVPGKWRVEVRVERAGRLVLADPYFPGWGARLDGAPAPLDAAAGDPMAVAAAPGTHEIEIAYRPASFRAGVAAALVGLVGLAVLLTKSRRSRRTG